MKFLPLYACALMVTCYVLISWLLRPQPLPAANYQTTPQLLPQRQIALHITERDLLLIDEQHSVLEQFVEADLYLKPQPGLWQGQLRHARLWQLGQWLELAQPIYFEVAVNDGVFGSVQWLGLPPEHPMRRLDFWLEELSVGQSTQQQIKLGQRQYRYRPHGHWWQRELLKQDTAKATEPEQLINDDWSLLLDSQQKISELGAVSRWQLKQPTATPLLRTRQLKASAIEPRPSWPALDFPLDINSKTALLPQQFLEFQRLKQLALLLAQQPNTALPLDELTNRVSVDNLSRLLHRYPAESKEFSRFLQGIQHYPQRQALLQQLSSRPVNAPLKIRLLRELAALPDANRTTLDLLTLASQSGNAELQKTGLFGLAKVLRQQPTLGGVIEPIFAQALRQRNITALVLTAIAQSGSRAFEAQAIQLVDAPEPAIRQAASALLMQGQQATNAQSAAVFGQ